MRMDKEARRRVVNMVESIVVNVIDDVLGLVILPVVEYCLIRISLVEE